MQGTVTVVSLTGDAWIKDENGNLRPLQEGDVVAPNATIVTADNASLMLSDERGVRYEMSGDEETTLSALDDADDDRADARGRDEAGDDDGASGMRADALLEIPAAVEGRREADDNDGGAFRVFEGNSFVRVARIALDLKPLAYEYDYGREDLLEWRQGGALSDDERDASPDLNIDVASPAVSVELQGAGPDGVYSQDEIGEDGSVTALVTLESGTEVGDTLIVTDEEGKVLDERVVTQDDLDNGVNVEVPVTPGDTEVIVNAEVTDPAGNGGSDVDQKPIDGDVTVDVPTDHEAVTPNGEIGDQVVFESGLADGSAPNADDIRVEASFTLTAPDGLSDTDAVSLAYTDPNGDPATLSLTRAQVEELGSTPQSVTTQYGTLTLNGYSQAADGTFTLDYSYKLTTAPESDVVDLMESVTVTASDQDGQSDSGDLNIKIVDDAPVAENDTNSVVEDASTTTTGNVLGDTGAAPGDVADTEGADGATVTGVTSNNVPGNSATDTGGTLTIEGEYGTLTIDAAGNYTYVLNNANPDVQGLSSGQSLTETFSYTLTDGDRDTDDATLTITIQGDDDGVNVNVPTDNEATTPDGDITDQVVFESGLEDGSTPNAANTQVESSFTLTAPDGLSDTDAVTLEYTDENGDPAILTLSKAQVEGLAGTPQSLNTQYGTLTLTGYDQAADGAITLDYHYELINAPDLDVEDLLDSFTITATDEDGSTDSGNLDIKIVDDAPAAANDTNAVTEGETLSVDAASGVLGNDQSGADGWTSGGAVIGVATGDSGGTAVTGKVGTVIVGTYGTLTLNADGSYTYRADPDSLTANAQDVFTYTVRDGDGDESTATLTIDVADVTGAPTDTTGSVEEAGLADGTDASSNSESITGGSLDLQSGWSVDGVQSGTTSLGTWTVNADGTFDYTLKQRTDDMDGQPETDSFQYTAVDQYGNTVTNTVTIDIVDDEPVVTATGAAPGSVTVDETDFNAAGAVSAEDPDFVNGVFDIDHGADNAATTDGTVYSLAVTAGTASGVTDTATGSDVYLFMEGDAVVGYVGNSETGEVAFRIELNSDGAVTLTQYRPLQHPDTENHDDSLSLTDTAIQLVATVTDGDGDTDSASVNVGGQFTFKDDGPSITGAPAGGVVDEAHLEQGSAGAKDPDQLTVSNSLKVDFGNDQAGDAQFTDGAAGSTTATLEGLGLTSGNTALKYEVSADGHTLIAYKEGESSASPVFTVVITDPTGSPGYDFTLNGALDHVKDGSTTDDLGLVFDTIKVTDKDGDSVTTDFTITVKDDNPAAAKPETVDEDSTNNVFTTNADATGTNTTIGDGSEGTIAPSHGEVTVNADGTITYVPDPNYSGEDTFTYTTVTDNEVKTYTVNVTVRPMSDAPDIPHANDTDAADVDATGVVTPEDTAVPLGLKLPKITDGEDRNGEGAGDNPERLGAITLTPDASAPAGTVLTQGDGTALRVNADGGYTIVIVKTPGGNDVDPDLHLASGLPTGDSVNYLTWEEYEAIKAQPVDDRHENFDVVVSVDSYEVDGDGNPLPDRDVVGTNGSNSQQTITVDVQAVTDAPNIALTAPADPASAGATTLDVADAAGESNAKISVTMQEDGILELQEVLGESLTDTDGSESYWYEISGLPEGTVVTIANQAYTAGSDGSISMPAGDYLNASDGGNPVFSIRLPQDYSNSAPVDATITLNTKDSDDDSTVTTSTESVSVDLELSVAPVAGDVAAADVTTPEDTAVNFLAGVRVTDTGSGSGTEVIDAVSFEVPAGWEVAAPAAGPGWSTSGDGLGGPYTITFDDSLTEDEREAVLDGFTITPPAHGSTDVTIDLTVTTTDSNGTDSDTVDSALPVEITVTPEAETTESDTDGANGNDVTINPDHAYATPGNEDGWLELGKEAGSGFNLEAGWTNEDGKGTNAEGTGFGGGSGSEDTYALLTPYDVLGNDLQANATGDPLDGSVFKYSDGTNTYEVIYNGAPVKIPVEYLDTLEFKGPKDFSGAVKIQVQAGTVDYDEDIGEATEMAVSGESWLTNLILNPVADQVTLSVNARVTTKEDTPVALNINPTSSDPSETFNVTILGIPEGAKITYDGQVFDTLADPLPNGLIKEADGTFTLAIDDFDRASPPQLTPPADSNASIDLTVRAVSVDTLEYIDQDGNPQSETSTSDPHELDIGITVQGVPDEPELAVVTDQTYVENELDEAVEPNQVDLNDLITSFGSGETAPEDPRSETVTLRISGLPEGFGLVGAGSALGGTGTDRVWVIKESQLNDVTITLPPNYSGTVSFTAQPVVTESDNDSETFYDPENVGFTVTPSPEATLNTQSNLMEDTIGRLDLSAVHQNGDIDEVISAVKIAAVPGLTLYSDADGTTELTAVDGFYVISGDDVDSLYAKAGANFSGTQGLDIQYKVTDPSQDPASPDAVPAVESDWIIGSHDLVVGAVTDDINATLNDITAIMDDAGDSYSFDRASSTVTVNGTGSVTVIVDVTQQPDANAGDQPDTDGSERLTHIVIKGVPDGVSVDGAVQTGPGQWLISAADGFNADTLTKDLIFKVTGLAGDIPSTPITITSYSKDDGADSQKEAEISFNLTVNQGPGDPVDLPEVSLTDKATVQTEDTEFSLSEQIGGTISGGSLDEYQMTVTLRTDPADDTVFTDGSGNPLTRTEVTENGQAVVLWTKTVTVAPGDDANAKLEQLLDSIQIQAPEHANDNNLSGGFSLDASVSVHADGVSKQDQLQPNVSLTPATDPTTVTVEAKPVGEGEDISLDIRLENEPDGDFANVEGDILYVKLGDTGLDGELYDGDTKLTPDGNGVYEIPLVDGQPPALTFRPDPGQPHQTGSLTVDAWVNNTETGAGNTITSEGSGSLVIEESNSGYDAAITAVGDEQTQDLSEPRPIELAIGGQGLLDADEVVDSAFIKGLPPGFTVLAGADAASATLANNAGKDADGNNVWALPVGEPPSLPGYIAIMPPTNWSGTLSDLILTVMSGESGLAPTGTDIGFDLVVDPVADGISLNPTLSFGDAGDVVELNLNAAMKDPVANDFGGAADGHTERTTLELTNLTDGEKTLFYINGVEMSADRVSFDSATGTHTITGLTQEELDGLGIKHLGTDGPLEIGVTAWTQEVDANGNAVGDPSASETGTMTLNVSDKLPTTGNDILLWTGEAIDGRAGEDTIELRLGENLSGGELAANLSNIEALDMTSNGSSSVTSLSAQDVLDMTDEGNELTILGDAADSLDLRGGDWAAGDTVTEGGTSFRIYSTTDSSAELRVQQEVNVEI